MEIDIKEVGPDAGWKWHCHFCHGWSATMAVHSVPETFTCCGNGDTHICLECIETLGLILDNWRNSK